jgi:pyruvate kinase
VRRASDETHRAIGILADLQGPKIRLGSFAGGHATLEPGHAFAITAEPREGNAEIASTTYTPLAADVHEGDTILLDDGNVRLRVTGTDGVTARTEVVEGGVISDHKGINLPGVTVSAPTLTPKDLDDLRFALSLRVDFVALSFVREPADAERVRAVMREMGAMLPVIAKIEKPEAVAHLDAIVEAFDGVMIARGDLGVEMALEEVPLTQKRGLRIARRQGHPAIVATQMLESMVHHPHPTRAEASDVANAVLDGADAVMLSAETSVGDYPVETVKTMARLIAAAERDGLSALPPSGDRRMARSDALAAAAARVAAEIHARALVACTTSGATARRLASHRVPIPLLAFTSDPAVRSQLALVWGVETFVIPAQDSTDAMIAEVERAMLALGRGQPGDRIVIVAGTPPGTSGNTNTIRVHALAG